jgi:WD40 repeat protein
MSLEFDHFIGLNSLFQGAIFHPDGIKYIFTAGANVVVGDLIDPHLQHFLRGHDDAVTSVALSSRGRLIASGQRGERSDVLVWDYESRQQLYRFEEHDGQIISLAFSDDEKILASLGADGNMILWDMSNGCIIVSTSKLPQGTCVAAFAGFIRDIKRRDTSHYQLCTAGEDGVTIWDIDPYNGEMVPFKLQGDVRATLTRHVTALSFSDDREYLFAATTSGDYLIANFKSQRILKSVQATKMALHTIMTHGDRIVIGCGDKTIKIYGPNGEYLNEVKLDGAIVGLTMSPDKLEVRGVFHVFLYLNSHLVGIGNNFLWFNSSSELK